MNGLSAKLKKPWWQRRWRWFASVAAVPLLVVLAFHLTVWCWPYPSARAAWPVPSALVLDRCGRELAAFASPQGQWHLPVGMDDMSPHLLAAVVAVEDRRFAEHGGVDWWSVAAACLQNVGSGRVVRGASTITMQVERLRRPQERTFLAKLGEAVRACQLERQHDKRALLVEYLNRAPFGGNLVGASAASWRYFARPCRELSVAQAALLAGLPQSPARLRPDRHPEAARARRDLVLLRMRDQGLIDAGQWRQAVDEPLAIMWSPLPQHAAETEGGVALYTGLAGRMSGTIATTLDAAVQRQTATAAERHLRTLAGSGADAAAVVVVDTVSGDLLAAVSVGGPALLDLTEARRSTGSALKPFIYAAAFAAGVSAPEALLDDQPAAWAGYAPANYDHVFRGQATAAEALAESRNLPAMSLLARVGLAHVTGVMEASGLRGLSARAGHTGLTLALGGAELSPRALAEGYATLARGGHWLPLRDLRRDLRRDEVAARLALPEQACWQCLGALSVPERTAAVSPEAVELLPAWKTGTSSGHRDAWCAAVTPRLTVVVWLGTAHGGGAPVLVGHDAAAPLALGLLAALDRGGARFPIADAISPTATRPPLFSPALTITSPVPGAEIVVDPDRPVEHRRLALRSQGGGAGQVWWFIDGNEFAATAGDTTSWWTPSAGVHRIRAVATGGRAADVLVTVR